MCEKTHALHLMFEYEKNLWIAKVRQETLDNAYAARQHNNAHQYREKEKQAEGSTLPYSTVPNADSDAQTSTDDDNSFLYEVCDEYDFVSIESGVVVLEEEGDPRMGLKKRKFSTPTRFPAVSVAGVVDFTTVKEDSSPIKNGADRAAIEQFGGGDDIMSREILGYGGIDMTDVSKKNDRQRFTPTHAVYDDFAEGMSEGAMEDGKTDDYFPRTDYARMDTVGHVSEGGMNRNDDEESFACGNYAIDEGTYAAPDSIYTLEADIHDDFHPPVALHSYDVVADGNDNAVADNATVKVDSILRTDKGNSKFSHHNLISHLSGGAEKIIY